MAVTDGVSKRGDEVSEKQSRNILVMCVTEDVSKRGAEVSE